MPSPIAHCKQSVILLVVSLFLLGCVVPSSVGSTVDIRIQNENNDLSKHSTAKKKKEKPGWATHQMPLNRLQTAMLKLLRGPRLGLDGPSGHYVGPHGCSSTRIVTK